MPSGEARPRKKRLAAAVALLLAVAVALVWMGQPGTLDTVRQKLERHFPDAQQREHFHQALAKVSQGDR